MKYAIRKFAIWLKEKTDKWIINPRIAELIDKERWSWAEKMIEESKQKWPNDPEVVYWQSFLTMMRDD